MNPKHIVTLALVMFSTAATTLAQSTRQIGAWSIYTIQAGGKNTVMLQTAAVSKNGAVRDGSGVTLSILCKNNKLSAIALHTEAGIDKHALRYTQDLPLTPVVASIEGRSDASEKWVVTENGHTFTPYSEIGQGKVNRQWLQRLNAVGTVAFQVGGSEGDNTLQPTFHTDQLQEALSAAGCTN